MDYYKNDLTDKSWQELLKLKKITDFILIGGWAVYLYSKRLKSKDIDIIVNFDQLSILNQHYRVERNERLKKYEARIDMVQIDIYCPYFSIIGIPVVDLVSHTNIVETFKVIDLNYLMALKIYTLGQRGRRPKGRKDLVDIISLFLTKEVDFQVIKQILKKYGFEKEIQTLSTFLKENFSMAELGLNQHYFSKIKKEIMEKLVQ